MSNPTDAPKKQGQRRRRRRGGRNRNNDNNNNSNRSQGQKGNSNKGGGNSNNSGRSRGRRGPRKPIKLSFWEKILVAIGLKEDPNKRRGKAKKSGKQASAPKSNTRNARSKEGGDRPKADTTRKRRNRDKDRKPGDTSSVKSSRVYVGNLSFDITEQDLKELFKGVGTVRGVEIVYNRDTHRSKGYGFVDMMNKEDAIRSVEVLHDQPFMGRNITVSGAKDKSESTDPDETEPTMDIKASDLELAPLPDKPEIEETSEPTAESTEAVETKTETVADAPAGGEEQQPKQA